MVGIERACEKLRRLESHSSAKFTSVDARPDASTNREGYKLSGD